MQVRLAYFARLREAFGLEGEVVEIEEGLDVLALKQWLCQRGEVWQAELSGARLVRAAINQELVADHTPIPADAELALFPPVTGG